jgi:hypothetical protein
MRKNKKNIETSSREKSNRKSGFSLDFYIPSSMSGKTQCGRAIMVKPSQTSLRDCNQEKPKILRLGITCETGYKPVSAKGVIRLLLMTRLKKYRERLFENRLLKNIRVSFRSTLFLVKNDLPLCSIFLLDRIHF